MHDEKVSHEIIFLKPFIEDRNMFLSKQFGFRKKMPSNDATFALLSTVYLDLDKVDDLLCIVCNMTKACDLLNHLLNKLGNKRHTF